MGKIKHTPGPWFHGGCVVYGNDHKLGGDLICDLACTVIARTANVVEANARLIELAPTAPHECDDPKCSGNVNRRKLELFGEMFRALLKIKQRMYSDPDPLSHEMYETIDIIEAVIAKAQQLEGTKCQSQNNTG